jgi:hypothetical protein
MKRFLKLPVYLVCIAFATVGFSCSDDDDAGDEIDAKSEALKLLWKLCK